MNRLLVPLVLAGAAALLLGMLVAQQPQLAVVLLALVIGVAALSAPTAMWVGSALVAALTFKGLTSVGALPAVATFLDIPLAWGALGVALLRQRHLPMAARLPVGLLVGLTATVAMSALFSHSELPRPVLYLALLGEPLALICAMLVDPPTASQRRALEKVLVALLALQVPLAYAQAARAGGPSDTVQGTLVGAGAGAHVVSGVAVLGIIWLLDRRPMRRTFTFALAALLVPIPFLADAKQVILALPFILVVSRWRNVSRTVIRVAAVVAAIAFLVVYFPAGKTALAFLERAEGGQGGKAAAIEVVWRESAGDPASILVGQGPAETVSRAAFLTTDALLASDSPLRTIGLRPARLSKTAEIESLTAGGGGTSFNSGLSSLVGVFGDIGLIGLAVYLATWLVVMVRLRARNWGEADAALSGIALFLVLGYVFDWWEQPPFTIVLAALTGLALTGDPLAAAFEDDGDRFGPGRGASVRNLRANE